MVVCARCLSSCHLTATPISTDLPQCVGHTGLVLSGCHILHQGVLVDLHCQGGSLHSSTEGSCLADPGRCLAASISSCWKSSRSNSTEGSGRHDKARCGCWSMPQDCYAVESKALSIMSWLKALYCSPAFHDGVLHSTAAQQHTGSVAQTLQQQDAEAWQVVNDVPWVSLQSSSSKHSL